MAKRTLSVFISIILVFAVSFYVTGCGKSGSGKIDEPSISQKAEPTGPIADLIRMSRSKDESLKRDAIANLSLSKSKASAKALADIFLNDTDPKIRKKALHAVGGYHKTCHPSVIKSLLKVVDRDKDISVKKTALFVLGYSKNDKVIDPLIKISRSDDKDIRSSAASSLGILAGGIKSPKGIERLKDMAKNDPEASVRQAAAGTFYNVKDPAIILFLTELFNDPDRNVRYSAVYSIYYLAYSKVKDPSVVDFLIGALDDKNPKVRKSAADALGYYDDKKAVNKLSLLLNDLFKGVRDEAADSLEKLGASKDPESYGFSKPSQELIGAELIRLSKKDDLDIKLGALTELGNIKDTRAVDTLIDALNDSNEKVRGAAAAALGSYYGPKDPRAIDPLIKLMLEDESEDVRRAAVYTMDDFKEPRVIYPIIEVIQNDSSESVRSAAVYQLRYIKDARSIAAIITALKNDTAFDVRNTAVSALGVFKEPAAVDALINALEDDPMGMIRARAAQTLGEYSGARDPRAVRPLIEALNDNLPLVREAAAKGLYYLKSKEATGPLIELLGTEKYTKVRSAVIKTLGNLKDPRSIDIFVKIVLEDPSDEMRKSAVSALDATDDPRTIDPLIQVMLNDSSEDVRSSAANALSSFREKRLTAPLTNALLNDKSEKVRFEAVETLNYIDDQNAAGALLKVLKTEQSEKVLAEAVSALGDLKDPRSIEIMISMYDKSKPEVRKKIVSSLGKLKDPRTIDLLKKALNDSDASTREYAAGALGRLAATYYDRADIVDALILALKDENADVREDAATALEGYRDPRAKEALIITLKDEDKWVRYHAVYALSYLGDENTIQYISPLLNDKEEYVRDRAKDALKKLGVSEGDIEKGPPFTTDRVAELVTKARNEDWSTSYDGFSGLGSITTTRVLDILLEMIDNRSGIGAKDKIISTLASYEGPRDERIYEAFVRVLKNDPEESMRSNVASYFGYLKDRRAVEHLIYALQNDASTSVKSSAASTLGGLNDVRAVDVLLVSLDDENSSVRNSSVSALGKLYKVSGNDRRIYDSLINKLRDEDTNVRSSTARSLGDIGDKGAISSIKTLLRDENEYVRNTAGDGLKKLGLTEEEIKGSGLQPQELLDQYIKDLKGSESEYYWNNSMRGKIIELVIQFEEPPVISDEGMRSMSQGKVAFDMAGDKAGFEDAEKKFKSAATSAPWWPDVYFNLALVQEELLKYSAAIENLNLYLLASPDADDTADVKQKIYEIEYKIERVSEAKGHLDKGNKYRDSKNYHSAISEYEEAIRLDTKSHWAHYQLGYSLSEIEQYDRAIESFKEAIRLKPDELPFYLSMGYSYGKRGDDDKALEIYERGLGMDPYGDNSIYVHLNLAHRYKDTGKYQKALDHYNSASWDWKDHPDKEKIPGWISEVQGHLGQ